MVGIDIALRRRATLLETRHRVARGSTLLQQSRDGAWASVIVWWQGQSILVSRFVQSSLPHLFPSSLPLSPLSHPILSHLRSTKTLVAFTLFTLPTAPLAPTPPTLHRRHISHLMTHHYKQDNHKGRIRAWMQTKGWQSGNQGERKNGQRWGQRRWRGDNGW